MDSFLAARKTKHENNYNFLSIRENCKYLIEDDVMDEFVALYEKEREQGRIPSVLQRIRPGGHISVRCDIDIKRNNSVESKVIRHIGAYCKLL